MKLLYKTFERFTCGMILSLMFLLPTGCDDFVEVDLPPNQLTGKAVFNDEVTAEAALMDIYAVERNNGILSGDGSGLSSIMAYYSDVLQFLGTSGNETYEFYEHVVQPSNRINANFWEETYSSIYACNAIIDGIENLPNLDSDGIKPIKGEALFMRAFLHFYLTILYGDIPYVVSTDYLTNTEVSRINQNQVFDLIVKDLLAARDLLTEEYLNPDRIRPNKWTVSALLSRVYIYQQEYEKAEEEASNIIASGLYTLDIPVEKVFLADKSNTIWQFKPRFSGINTLEAQTFTINSAPPSTGALRKEFVNDFVQGDLRRVFWIDSISNEENTWYFSAKYEEEFNSDTSLEYSKIFRIAEIYLIRAEARLGLGKLEEALADINQIRLRAGLQEYEDLNDSAIFEELVTQRKFELFTEFGHRWFDLKRFGLAEEILSPLKAGWSSASYLMPIPETELLANPNLKPQNPGY